MAVFAILQTEEKVGAVFHRIPQILCRMKSLVQPQRLNQAGCIYEGEGEAGKSSAIMTNS